VHAVGQVAHVDLPDQVISSRKETLPTDQALSRWLPRAAPDDITIRCIQAVSNDFDARFAAQWRRYIYRLWDDRRLVDPRRRRYIHEVAGPLDTDLMHTTAQHLLGLNNFAAFAKPRPGATCIRTMLDTAVSRTPEGLIELTFTADAFCHSMVRSLTGGLIAVGQAKRPPNWFTDLIGQTNRCGDIHVAAARGLTLEEVGYPPAEDWAQRIQTSRQRRQPSEPAA
jgi:tRNA pseudouridine38-40 synthase